MVMERLIGFNFHTLIFWELGLRASCRAPNVRSWRIFVTCVEAGGGCGRVSVRVYGTG